MKDETRRTIAEAPPSDLTLADAARGVDVAKVREARARGRSAAEAYRLRALGVAAHEIARCRHARDVELACARAASRRAVLKRAAWGTLALGLLVAPAAAATGPVSWGAVWSHVATAR